MPYLLADITVSTGVAIIAMIALSFVALMIVVALFGPGLSYKMSSPHSEPNDSADFLNTLEVLTDAKLTHSRLEVLPNGPCFYEAELAAMAAAQRSINIEAYIFQTGEIAERFVKTLTQRARAGVKVNIVLDGVGSASVSGNYFTELQNAGGKVHWYNALKWHRLPNYNRRTHRELIVVDGRIGFLGGAGIADHWYKGDKRHPRWRDTMIKVEGPAVAHLQGTFAENCLESSGELLTGEDYFPGNLPKSETEALVVNSTPSQGGSTRARILFQLLIASAKRTIHVTTPYFLPDKSMIDEFVCAARERSVQVVVLAPGKKSDHAVTRSSSQHAYGELLKAGAVVFEYQPSMIHAKILIVDGLWSVVGSTNFDNRSFGLNDEVNLAVRDEGFARRLEADFTADLANSCEITYQHWKRRPLLQRAPELIGAIFERQQ